jgi:ADP-ribosylation factor protein 1
MNSSFKKVSFSSAKQDGTRILVCGLESAGKTSILNVAQLGEVVTTIPTIDIDFQAMPYGNQQSAYGNQQLTQRDYGGRCVMRPLRRHYYQNTSALVFVVDSNDWGRMSEACNQLHEMANKDELKNQPILIFANKQDLPNAQSLDELKEGLKLSKLDEMKTKWHLQSTIATKNEGIKEGFAWLANAVQTKSDLAQPNHRNDQ